MTAAPQADDPQTLVSTDWLAAHLDDPNLRILDASWYLPTEGRAARTEYDAAHIPGAAFFDIEEISDTQSSLPHMAPPPEKFAAHMRALGIGEGQQVVIYDGAGIFSAPRAWWTFRLMGHRAVAVLDGGLPKWQAERRIVTQTRPSVRERAFSAARQSGLVADVTEVARAAKLATHTILDARAPARFAGSAPEPRAGLRAGHIPGSVNVFYKALLTEHGTLKDPDALRAVFDSAGADLSRPVITSCGSGVTAAILSLALERIQKFDHSLYDGSWAEWGMYADLPISKGQD